MIKRIISGGQTGVDQAGLYAAVKLGIPTGGWAPPGYMTENGPAIHLLRDTFHLRDMPPIPGQSMREMYRDRTIRNIKDSDLTFVWDDVGSPGSQLTYMQCEILHKPVYKNPTANIVRTACEDPLIQVINIAGNRASVNPGIFKRVHDLLIEALAGEE